MKCSEARKRLSSYVDGEAGEPKGGGGWRGLAKRAPVALAIREHVASCESCRAEERRLRLLWDVLGRVGVPEPSGSLPDRIMKGLGAGKAETRPAVGTLGRGNFLAWPLNAAMAAALALGLSLGVLFGYLFTSRLDGSTSGGAAASVEVGVGEVFSELPEDSPAWLLAGLVNGDDTIGDDGKEDME